MAPWPKRTMAQYVRKAVGEPVAETEDKGNKRTIPDNPQEHKAAGEPVAETEGKGKKRTITDTPQEQEASASESTICVRAPRLMLSRWTTWPRRGIALPSCTTAGGTMSWSTKKTSRIATPLRPRSPRTWSPSRSPTRAQRRFRSRRWSRWKRKRWLRKSWGRRRASSVASGTMTPSTKTLESGAVLCLPATSWYDR